MDMKIGDKVKYTPVQLSDMDKPVEGIITMVEFSGKIFNQPMIVIDTVEHWIPAYECKVIE